MGAGGVYRVAASGIGVCHRRFPIREAIFQFIRRSLYRGHSRALKISINNELSDICKLVLKVFSFLPFMYSSSTGFLVRLTEQDAMTHNNSLPAYSNRPASRRLHRRLALSVVSSCVVNANILGKAPVVATNLPRAIGQEYGLFERLAAESRIAELEKALAEVSEVACIDPLTGALNRRGFDKACRRELARARRSGVKFTLAHIDLDDFKHLNDTLGHQAGDQALIHLVSSLHKSMRPSDVLCRFGGEEFVLMFPDTTLNDASTAISRFLSDFSSQMIPGTDRVMTFSAGVVVHDLDESIDAAIARADAATYAAKRAGKNRVIAC